MNRRDIKALLGSEYAQDDKYFHDYAVLRSDLLDILGDDEQSYVIINAARGSGKSGLLLSHERQIFQLSPSQNVVIKKYYQDVRFPDDDIGIGASVQWWRRKLFGWIVSEIGASIDVPVTDEEIFAVEWAEREGRRKAPKPINSPQSTTRPRLEESETLFDRIIEASPKRFWLLLDEMDDLYADTGVVNHCLVGLLQASKFITQRHDNVRVRLTIRPHIMTILKNTFDVVQRIRANEVEIGWNEEQLREILVRRILRFDAQLGRQPELQLTEPRAYALSKTAEQCAIIDRYFEDFDVSFAKDKTSNYRALQTFSLGRPRWMIEFCIIALQSTDAKRATRDDFNKAVNKYGANRVQFLAGEHSIHLPEIQEHITGIASARKTVFGTAEALRRTVLTHCLGVREEDIEVVDLEKDRRALQIANSLYMLEIIRPKQLAGGRNNHRFVSYLERPSTLATWSSEPKFIWEMHPVFARTLNIVDSQTYRVGPDVRLFGEKKKK